MKKTALLLAIFMLISCFTLTSCKKENEESAASSPAITSDNESINEDESESGHESVNDDDTASEDESAPEVKDETDNEAFGDATIKERYENALEYIESKQYEKAYSELCVIKDNKKAAELLKCFKVVYTKEVFHSVNVHGSEVSETIYTTEYKYDENGNLIKESKFDKHGTLKYEKEIFYVENHKVKETEKSFDDSYCSFEYLYDKNDLLIQTIVTEKPFANSKPITYNISPVYDEKNNLIKETYDSGEVYEYKYDDNNNVIYCSMCSNGELWYIYQAIYDENNNVIKETRSNKNGVYYTKEYVYDGNNNLTKDTITSDDSVYISEYFYDKNNNLIKRIDDNDLVTEYTYDSNNNLIKQTFTDESDEDTTEYSDFLYFYIPAK